MLKKETKRLLAIFISLGVIIFHSACTDSKSLFAVEEKDEVLKEQIILEGNFKGCLSATQVDADTLKIEFEFPSDYEQIKILRNNSVEVYSSKERSVTSYIDTDLKAGNSYTYTVAATKDSEYKSGTKICTANLSTGVKPIFSGIYSVEAGGQNSVTVKWPLPNVNASGEIVKGPLVENFIIYFQPTRPWENTTSGPDDTNFPWTTSPHITVPNSGPQSGLYSATLNVCDADISNCPLTKSGKPLGDQLLYRFAVRACSAEFCDDNTKTIPFTTPNVGGPKNAKISKVEFSGTSGNLLVTLDWDHRQGCVMKRELFWRWHQNPDPISALPALSTNTADYHPLQGTGETSILPANPTGCIPHASQIIVSLEPNTFSGINGTFSNKTFDFILQDTDYMETISSTPARKTLLDTEPPTFDGVLNAHNGDILNCTSAKPEETCVLLDFNKALLEDNEGITVPYGAKTYTLYWNSAPVSINNQQPLVQSPCVFDSDTNGIIVSQNSLTFSAPNLFYTDPADYPGTPHLAQYVFQGSPPVNGRTRYNFCLRAKDTFGNESKTLNNFSITTKDITPPNFGGVSNFIMNSESQTFDVYFLEAAGDTDVYSYTVQLFKLGSITSGWEKVYLSSEIHALPQPAGVEYNNNIFKISIPRSQTTSSFNDNDQIFARVIACDDANMFAEKLNNTANCQAGIDSFPVAIPDLTAPQNFAGLSDLKTYGTPSAGLEISWNFDATITETEKADYKGFRIYHVKESLENDGYGLEHIQKPYKTSPYLTQIGIGANKDIICPVGGCFQGASPAYWTKSIQIPTAYLQEGKVYKIVVTAFDFKEDGGGNETDLNSGAPYRFIRSPDHASPSSLATQLSVNQDAYEITWESTPTDNQASGSFVEYETKTSNVGYAPTPAPFRFTLCRDETRFSLKNGGVWAPLQDNTTGAVIDSICKELGDGSGFKPYQDTGADFGEILTGHDYYYAFCARDRSNNITCAWNDEYWKVDGVDITPPEIKQFYIATEDSTDLSKFSSFEEAGVNYIQILDGQEWGLEFEINDDESCIDISSCTSQVKIEVAESLSPTIDWNTAQRHTPLWLNPSTPTAPSDYVTVSEVGAVHYLTAKWTLNDLLTQMGINPASIVHGYIHFRFSTRSDNAEQSLSMPPLHFGEPFEFNGLTRAQGSSEGGKLVVIEGRGLRNALTVQFKKEGQEPKVCKFGRSAGTNPTDCLILNYDTTTSQLMDNDYIYLLTPNAIADVWSLEISNGSTTLAKDYTYVAQSVADISACDKIAPPIGSFAAGAGSVSDPYLICNTDQLITMVKSQITDTNLNNYKLGDHIDYGDVVRNSDSTVKDKAFYGTFDGKTSATDLKPKVIYGLKDESSSTRYLYLGLFPKLLGATIKNTTIVHANILHNEALWSYGESSYPANFLSPYPMIKVYEQASCTCKRMCNPPLAWLCCDYYKKLVETGTTSKCELHYPAASNTCNNISVKGRRCAYTAFGAPLSGFASKDPTTSRKTTIDNVRIQADEIAPFQYNGGLLGAAEYTDITNTFVKINKMELSEKITNCSSDQCRRMMYYIGGLIGATQGGVSIFSSKAEIKNMPLSYLSINTGANLQIDAAYIGGLIGSNQNDLVADQVSVDINIHRTDENFGATLSVVGGLFGQLNAVNSTESISNAYAKGKITTTSTMGGIAGRIYVRPTGTMNLSNIFSLVEITEEGAFSGVAPNNTNSFLGTILPAAGAVNTSPATFDNTYWNTDIGGSLPAEGYQQITTASDTYTIEGRNNTAFTNPSQTDVYIFNDDTWDPNIWNKLPQTHPTLKNAPVW